MSLEFKTVEDYLAQFGYKVEDLDINENQLEVEAMKQSSLLQCVSDKATSTKEEWDRAKAKLKSETAKLSLSIRRGETDIGVPKLSEGTISDYIDCAKELEELREQEITLRYQSEQWSNFVESVRAKGFSLKLMSDLFSSKYWSV